MTGSLLFISSGACQNSATDEIKGKVREAVLDAKASGRSQIQILAPLITPTFVDSLYTVGEQYTVIVGQPLQIVTAVAVDGYIRTWYKFKVSEVLRKQPDVPTEPALEEHAPPAALLPLGADEVLLSSAGGSIVSEGITVVERSPYEFRLRLDRQYVLTVYLESSGAIAARASTSDGFFELQADGSILPMGRTDLPLAKDIYVRTGNSLEFLRRAVKEQRR
jgi:hypothetical protein